MRSSFVLFATLAVLPSVARAETAEQQANALAAKGDFVGAAAKFLEAFAGNPRPDLMCNVGVAYTKARDLPRAHRYLTQCLEIGTTLDAQFVQDVRAVIANLETKLVAGDFTPVDIVVSPQTATTTVLGGKPFDEPIVGSRRVWFPFGRYQMTVRAPGHRDKTVEVAASSRTAIQVSAALDRAPIEPPKQDTPPPKQEPSVPSGPVAPAAEPRSKVPAIVTFAISGGAAIAAGGMYMVARKRIDQAELELERPAFDAKVDSAHNWRLASVITVSAAGAGAAIATWLLLRSRTPQTHIEVDTSGGGASVLVGGSW